MEQWKEFVEWCQENAPLYREWIAQYLKRHVRNGKTVTWIKWDVIKHFNTIDLMRPVLVERLGEELVEAEETERTKIREKLHVVTGRQYK